MKGKNIVIILLSIMVALLGGFVIYDKFISKPNEKMDREETQSEENVEKAYDLAVAKELVDKYFVYVDLAMTSFDKMDEYAKRTIAYENLDENKKVKANCEKLYKNHPNAKPYGDYTPVDYFIEKDDYSFLCGMESYAVKYEDMNEVYTNLFGTDIEKKSINAVGFNQFDYHAETEQFIKGSFYGGGDPNVIPVYDVKSAIIHNEELIVDIGYIWLEGYNSDSLNEYITYLDHEHITYNSDDSLDDFIDKYLDKFDTYRFTFKKVDNNYVLDSFVEVLK